MILFAGALGAWAIIGAKPEVETKLVEHGLLAVEVVTAQPQAVRLDVHSQGVVAPRTEIDLVSEVSGKVLKVHPAFAAGGFFKAGEVLVSIDPRDYDFSPRRDPLRRRRAWHDALPDGVGAGHTRWLGRRPRAPAIRARPARPPGEGRAQLAASAFEPGLYGIDVAEMRLPITNEQLDLVALPLSYRIAPAVTY